MKGVWARRVNLEPLHRAGFDVEINYNFRHHSHADKVKTLEEGARYGIKIIPDLTSFLRFDGMEKGEDLVRAWKDNPNIGGWQLEDEPQIYGTPLAKQIEFYDRIKSIDSVHPLSIAFMADNMKGEYYSPRAFDFAMVDYYPVRPGYNWRELLERNLSRWIATTGNRDIIPCIQGHYLPSAGLSSPVGTIQGQYDIWKAHGLVDRGWTIYEWFTTAGDGLAEDPRVLAEVTAFNGGTTPPPPYPCPFCSATFTSQAELDAHIASAHPGPIYPCPFCPATFTSQAELDAHIVSAHPSNGAIHVGNAAINRPNYWGNDATFIDKNNPANLSGKLKNVEIHLYRSGVVSIGVFYIISGNTLKCRSKHECGERAAGHHNIAVDMAINAGDYIGAWIDAEGMFDQNAGLGLGFWYFQNSNKCVVGNQTTYTFFPADLFSLYGTGTVSEVIITQTTRHTCNALIEYKVSSIAENNNTLSCPHCGLSLGVAGIKGSGQMIEEPEVVTPHIVICQGCGSKLELSISSIANKNVQQYCPVCGEAAD